MLAREIRDDVESAAGVVRGLGLLPARVAFATEKTLARPEGTCYGERVAAYEIHHGQTEVVWAGSEAVPFLDGCRAGAVWGTTWHGALENDAFRRAFLADVAGRAGRRFVAAGGTDFAAERAARLDALGDMVEEHMDTDAIWRLLESGAPSELPVVAPAGTAGPAETG